MEMLETVLMRTFMMLYVSDFEGDDDRCPNKSGKSRSAEHRSFSVLASVCWFWRQTLSGWPHSPTKLWLRHQIKQHIECEYTLLVRVTDLQIWGICTKEVNRLQYGFFC